MAAKYEELMDVEAEKSFLSTILINNDVLLENNISADDFAIPAHRQIYIVMQKMYQSGQPIEMVTLTVELKDLQKLNDVGGVMAITNLGTLEATASRAKFYAGIISGFAQRRRLYQACREIAGEAVNGDSDFEHIINHGLMKIAKISDASGADQDVVEGFDLMCVTADRLMEENNIGIRTGFRDLDHKLVYGLRSGDLVILAGRPSMGKTAMALNLVTNTLRSGKHILFFSLETGLESIGQRLLQAHLGLNQFQILQAKNNEAIANRLLEGTDYFTKHGKYLHVNTGGYHTPESIAAVSRKTKIKNHGLDLIIIDHLQLISAEGFRNNRLAEMTYISRKLKQLSKDLECPILVLSQLNRAVESRDDKRPRLSDLRESGSIEQDADIVLLLYRDGYYHPENDNRSVEVIVAKQKDGPTGNVKLTYFKEFMKFTDAPDGQIDGQEISDMEIPL